MDLATPTPLKIGSELRCSGRVSGSCSISATRRATLATHPVVSHRRATLATHPVVSHRRATLATHPVVSHRRATLATHPVVSHADVW